MDQFLRQRVLPGRPRWALRHSQCPTGEIDPVPQIFHADPHGAQILPHRCPNGVKEHEKREHDSRYPVNIDQSKLPAQDREKGRSQENHDGDRHAPVKQPVGESVPDQLLRCVRAAVVQSLNAHDSLLLWSQQPAVQHVSGYEHHTGTEEDRYQIPGNTLEYFLTPDVPADPKELHWSTGLRTSSGVADGAFDEVFQ